MRLSLGYNRKVVGGALFAAILALLAVGVWAPAAAEAKTPKVLVADDYFSPTKVKIKQREKVKFVWDSMNLNSHNVSLRKGPKRVKKRDFRSRTGAIGLKFSPKFKKRGTYKFICTIHPTVMRMTVKVKKARKKRGDGKGKKRGGKKGKRRRGERGNRGERGRGKRGKKR